MKVMIPLDEDKKTVCVSFGRAPFFMIYDTETRVTEYVKNPGAEAQGGAGIKAAQCVVDHGGEVLITVRCGENAAEVFKAAGIKIYKSVNKEAKTEIKALLENKLEELTHFHAGFHGLQ